jgi:hypothetical protein
MMKILMKASTLAAMMPPRTGEITQLAAMEAMVGQCTAPKPAAAMPAPITPPTTAWVVETGAFSTVARFTHRAEEISAAIISQTKVSVVGTVEGSMMPLEMVETTSPPASRAPALSQMAAMMRAPPMVSALEPTAGPTLLATSLAPILRAM